MLPCLLPRRTVLVQAWMAADSLAAWFIQIVANPRYQGLGRQDARLSYHSKTKTVS
jgi:hypothetical protein